MNVNSHRVYPTRSALMEYKEAIEKIEDKATRVYVKLIMCCGFRIGEIMNSYLYLDDENNLVIRAIAEKAYSITKHKFEIKNKHPYTYPKETLDLYFRTSPQIFKSVKLVNVLGLDIEELKDLVSPSFTEPNWVAYQLGKPTYAEIYRALKSDFTVKTKVYLNRLSEPVKMETSPAFHFFRKLFSTVYNEYIAKRDLVKTVEYMKWVNPTIIFIYNKSFD